MDLINILFAKALSNGDTDEAIKALKGEVSADLDTLEELSKALGNDPNFFLTIKNEIDGFKTELVTNKDAATENTRFAIGVAEQNLEVPSMEEFNQLKDRKLDNMPATWPAWTSAEQKAARERMGVDKPYELIEEIVLEEEATVLRRTEPGGAEYNFSAMALRVEFPAVDKSGNIPIEFRLGTLNSITSYFISPYDKNALKYGFCRCWLDGTVYRIGWWTCVHNPGEFAYYYENPIMQNKYFASNGNITSVNIGAMPVGTKIEIYGVRA